MDNNAERKRDELNLTALVATRTHKLAQARDAAEAANRAKSDFLAHMSHEIRTPMNAILGLTHLMTAASSDPLQRDRLSKVDSAARHLLQIISDVLDLSKIEAGRMTLEDTEFSLDQLLSRVEGLFAEPARAKGLALTVEAADLPERLRGDPTRLSQVLINLVGNALKFTQHGSVRLCRRLLTERDGRCRLNFQVNDTGEGVAPDRQQALFVPFAQADASVARRHGGTGLGLALTRQLVTLMGGEIGMSSAPGVGSSFWFTVSLERAASPAALACDGAAPAENAEACLRRDHAGRRVLLAEDNPVNREVASALLEAVGLEVDCASDGEQAVAMALTGCHDLLLMDMRMPRLDGLQAARAIRRAGADMPIIAMTANAFREDCEACLAAGMNDHVAKPADPVVLYATLLRWLRQAVPAG